MLRGAVGKVMWVGRATVFLVGLAVILALVFGAASAALGANGNPFILGKANVATKVSTLTNKGLGAALSLNVQPDQPPLAVNSSTRVGNLNADQLDGKGAEDFQAAGSKAADADKLDGKDSSEFAASAHRHDDRYYAQADSDARFVNEADHTKAAHDALGVDAGTLDGRDSSQFAPASAEAWREVGAPGQPAFRENWSNTTFSFEDTTAAFYRDPYGVVHLKGTVAGGTVSTYGGRLFDLPCGYGPSKVSHHAVMSNNALGQVMIMYDPWFYEPLQKCTGGEMAATVYVMPPSSNVWVSLDGITFRAADS
jgi:hypothetical protein